MSDAGTGLQASADSEVVATQTMAPSICWIMTGVSAGIGVGLYVRADQISFPMRTMPWLEVTSSVTSPIRPTYRLTLQGEGPVSLALRLVSKLRSQSNEAIETTAIIMICTYRGAPRTSAIMAVRAPMAINRKVISPVTTCTLINNSIMMSQKDQKLSRIHSIMLASHMSVHDFRILR